MLLRYSLLVRSILVENNVASNSLRNSPFVSLTITFSIVCSLTSFFTRAKTFSIGFSAGDQRGIGHSCNPTSSCASLDSLEFCEGSPCCSNILEFFPLLQNTSPLSKISYVDLWQAKRNIYPPIGKENA